VAAKVIHPQTTVLPIEPISPYEILFDQIRGLSYVGGILAWTLVVVGMWHLRRLSPVTVFLAAYAGVLCIWPWHDDRFWAPVLPFLFAFAWIGLRTVELGDRRRRAVLGTYMTVFCLLGGIALGHSLYQSLAERDRMEQVSRRWLAAHREWDAVQLFLD
jgi:hypothetical protein